MDIAVGLLKRRNHDGTAGAVDSQRPIGLEPVLGKDRRILAAGRRLEAICEPGAQSLQCRRVGIDVDAAALVEREHPQIVDAVDVVGVGVGEQHRIEPGHLGLEQLLAQVRRSVDQHRRVLAGLVGALDQ